jgi:starvation-inducible outer membrane lipoprotein
MRRLLLLGMAFVLAGCGDLPDSSDVQDQQMQRSFYGTGNPASNNPAPDNEPKRESVPGEVVPDH